MSIWGLSVSSLTARRSVRTVLVVSSVARSMRGSVLTLKVSTTLASASVPLPRVSSGPPGALIRCAVWPNCAAAAPTWSAVTRKRSTVVCTPRIVTVAWASAGSSRCDTVFSRRRVSWLVPPAAWLMFSSASAMRFWLASPSSVLTRSVTSCTRSRMSSPLPSSRESSPGSSGMRGGLSSSGTSLGAGWPRSDNWMKASPVTPW
jgi:hypothetical protein